MRKLLLSAAAWALATSVALAQVNVVPSPGLVTQNLRQQTYSAISVGLVPAASATDIACIAASSTKNIYVKAVFIGGTAGTAITIPVILLRRNTALDSGGTAATGLALPVGAPNYFTNGTASATLTAYTANPTVNDASPSYLRAGILALPTSGATIAQQQLFYFGTDVENFDQEILLAKGSTQQMCVNLNGSTFSTGSLSITFEWTEQ